jgi:hypothetical protein
MSSGGLGRLAALLGLVGFPPPFVGGLLCTAFGIQTPLLAGLVGVVVETVMLVTLVEEPQRRVEGTDPGN